MRRGELLEALAGGNAVLAEAQAAMAAARDSWRSDPCFSPLWAGLKSYGAAETQDPPVGVALAAVDALLGHMLPALAAFPLGQVPMRHGQDEKVSSLLLAREGRGLLSLVAREPGLYQRRAAGFDEGERHETVLAGKAHARRVRRRDGLLHFDPVILEPGVTIALDPGQEALLVDEVETRLVSLRIDRLPEALAPVREYCLETGELLHQSTGNPLESRLELALAILGRMRRKDAAPVMAELALSSDADGSDHLRWQALRECIALDTAAGLDALRKMAADPADPLRAPAARLMGELHAAYPQLHLMEAA